MTDLPTRLAALRARLDALPQEDPVVRGLRKRLDELGSPSIVGFHYWLTSAVKKLAAEIAEREAQ